MRQDMRLLPVGIGALAGAKLGFATTQPWWVWLVAGCVMVSGVALLSVRWEKQSSGMVRVISESQLSDEAFAGRERLVKSTRHPGGYRHRESAGKVPGGERRNTCWRVCIMIALAGAVAIPAGMMCSLHVHASRPDELVHAVETGGTVTGRVRVLGRVSHSQTPWGESSCEVSGVPVDLNVRNSPVRLSRSTRVLLQGLPCEALAGQVLSFTGTVAQSGPEDREAVRVRIISGTLEGSGNTSAQFVARVDTALTGLLKHKPVHAQGLVPGIALGDDTRATLELTDAMKVTQLTHLIAVSGGHISIVTGIVIAIVGRRNTPITAAICLGSVVALVLLVGAQASVIRAVLMSVVVLSALAVGRSTQAVAALCAAITAAALVDPWLALSYGFLLSASATAGIVMLGGPLRRALAKRVPSLVADAIAIPFAAQMACLPVLALFSDEGSVWGVLANAVIAPVVAPLTVAGLSAALLSPFAPHLAEAALLPAQMCTWWIDSVARELANWPGSGVSLRASAIGTVILFAIAYWTSPGVVVGIGVCALVLTASTGVAHIPKEWVVIQCDVGQGSALIARVDGVTIMVDVGPESSDAKTCVEGAGISQIDVLVLSHDHADHVGGLAGVLEAAAVTRVIRSPVREPAANSAWVDQILENAGVGWETGTVDTAITGESGPVAQILWPKGSAATGSDPNAGSLVVDIDVAGGVIVMADVGQEEQEAMAATVPASSVLIMAHHGSSSQSERFANAVAPTLTLISVGENTYGHPSDRALDVYGFSRVFVTSVCGTISLTDKGDVVSGCAADH